MYVFLMTKIQVVETTSFSTNSSMDSKQNKIKNKILFSNEWWVSTKLIHISWVGVCWLFIYRTVTIDSPIYFNGFYLSCVLRLISSYPFSVGMINRISFPSPTGSGVPASSPILQWIKKIIIKINVFFIQQKDVDDRWLWWRRGKSPECEILKEKREKYDKWLRDSDCVSKMI